MIRIRQWRGVARGAACTMAFGTVAPAWAGVINIDMPRRGDAVGGSNIACLANFKSAGQPISRVEFLVDGHELVPKVYPTPTPQARVTFVWDATGVPQGAHVLSVRAYSGTVLLGEDTVPVVVSADGQDIVKPQVHIYYPKPNSTVQGQQDIAIQATDNLGVAMVSLFIDKQLKLLQNIPPYRYTWDTTQYPNGPHTLEVWAFDRAQNKGVAPSIKLFVNNPTGRTDIKDLPDDVPAIVRSQSSVKSTSRSPSHAAAIRSRVNVAPGAAPTTSRVAPARPVTSLHVATRVPAARPPIVAIPLPAVPRAPLTRVTVNHAALPVVPSPMFVPARDPSTSVTPSATVGNAFVHTVPAPAMRSAHSVAPAMGISQVGSPMTLPDAAMPRRSIVSTTPRPRLIARPARTMFARAPSLTLAERLNQRPAPRTRAVSPATIHRIGVLPAAPVLTALPSALHPHTYSPGLRSLRPETTSAMPVPIAAPKPVRRVQIARAEFSPRPALGHAISQEAATESPAVSRTRVRHAPLRIQLGAAPIDFDVQPIVRDGMAIAPIRQIIEHTGGVVMWLPATRTVQAMTGHRHLELTIGSRRATMNSQTFIMERPALLQLGRTMVPVRFLQVALDMKAVYDPQRGLVSLYTP